MIARRAVAAIIAATACLGCSGSDRAPRTRLRLDDVAPAVAAVEQARGGSPRYTEINVGPDLVNLFVVVDDLTELAFVYRSGRLEAPDRATPRVAGSVPFAVDGVDLEAIASIDETLGRELPDSALTRLGLLDAPPSGLAWRALMASAKGGTFEVVVGLDGSIVGAAVDDG